MMRLDLSASRSRGKSRVALKSAAQHWARRADRTETDRRRAGGPQSGADGAQAQV